MADIELVIRISEEKYRDIQGGVTDARQRKMGIVFCLNHRKGANNDSNENDTL